MAVGLQLASIFLVCLLSEANYSSAFPRVSSSGYTETRQGLSKKPQEEYGFGNRRPLQYIRALRQSYRDAQTKIQDQAQVTVHRQPHRNTVRVHNQAQIQSQPDLFSQTQNQYQAHSDVTTKWPQEESLPQTYAQPIQYRQKQAPQHFSQLGPSSTLSNYPHPKPRGFEFSIKVPFANFPNKNHEIGGGTKSPDVVSGGDSQSTYRPTSVNIHSSFNRPSSSVGFSVKGSTNNLNGANSTHKPSFQLSISVPIPPSTTSKKPSSSKVGFVENLHEPSSAGNGQNSYLKPEQREETGPAHSGLLPDSGFNVQKEAEQRTNGPVQINPTDTEQVKFSTEQANQHNTPMGQTSAAEFPTEQSGFFKPSEAKHPPLSLTPPSYPPPQYENEPSIYYSSQLKPISKDYGKGQHGQPTLPDPTNAIKSPIVSPTFAPLQYEKAQSGHYSGGQLKPSGSSDGKGQIEQNVSPVNVHPSFDPEQYNHGQFKPFFGKGQNEQTIRHPINSLPLKSPTSALSQYEQPSFEHNNEIATSTSYLGKGDMGPTEQIDITEPIIAEHPSKSPSFSPYQYNESPREQSMMAGPLIVTDDITHYPYVSSTYHQTQTQPPTHYTGEEEFDGKRKFTKLVIDAEHERTNLNSPSEHAVGQHAYSAPPSTSYDVYSDKWTRQNIPENPIMKPDPVSVGFSQPQPSSVYGQGHNVLQPASVSQPESTGFGYEQQSDRSFASSFETFPGNQPESYMSSYSATPSGDSEDGQYVNNPQKQMDTEQTWYSDPMPAQTYYTSYLGASDSSVPTYFDKMHIEQGRTSEPTSEPMPGYFGTSQYGQYSGSYLQLQQHTSENIGQTIETSYPDSVSMISHSDLYGSSHYNQISSGNQYSSEVTQHGNTLGSPSQTDQHTDPQQMAYFDPASTVVSNQYEYKPFTAYESVFQPDPSNFNPPQDLNVWNGTSVNAPQLTKYPSSVLDSTIQEPTFELNIDIPVAISSTQNAGTLTPPSQSQQGGTSAKLPQSSQFPSPSTALHHHNTPSNRGLVQVSRQINPWPQLPQYTLPTTPYSLHLIQQQRVPEVNPFTHSTQSTSSNSYFSQVGRPITVKPFVSDYSLDHLKPSSVQHFQQAANTAKPFQSFQSSYQESTSYSGGFPQATTLLSPGPQMMMEDGYTPSSLSREPQSKYRSDMDVWTVEDTSLALVHDNPWPRMGTTQASEEPLS